MTPPENIVFIDSRVADVETLIAGLGVDHAWVVLHGEEDGIRQMQRALRGRDGIDSIRILAHGRPGAMMLGAGQIDIGTLDQQAEALAEIGATLGTDGDVQLYCCELGQGPTGRAFVDALSEALGAHVAAASAPVGHADLGGTWKLDVGHWQLPVLDLTQWHGMLAVSYTTPTANNWQRSFGEWMNGNAFAALRADGSVVTWGISTSGGDSSNVAAALNGNIDVVQIFSTGDAFAALRADGSVITWGDTGGDSSSVAAALDGHIDVVQICSTVNAFAALRANGSVVTWGFSEFGGDSSGVAAALDGSIDVKQVYATSTAFAALRTDGSVITWGSAANAGDSSGVATGLDGSIDVVQIFSTSGAFAALRADGSVVTWGQVIYGGNSSGVAAALDGSIDVVQVFSTQAAFAALRADGSVVTWGNVWTGGDSSDVAGSLNGSIDVLEVFAGSSSFAALRVDGSVVTWGDTTAGADSNVVAAALDGRVDVVQIFATGNAFAALRIDGSVITWGDTTEGGDSNALAAALNGSIDVVQIFATSGAFAALRADGSVVTWGDTWAGGDSDSVANKLHDVISMANPLPTEGYKIVIGGIAYSYFDAYTLGGSEQNGRVMSRTSADLSGNGLANTLYAGTSDNVLDGQAGSDTVSYAYAGAGVTVSLATMHRQDTEGSGIDTLTNIENLSGSAFDDTLTGNGGANTLNGRAGADILIGRDGSDVYYVDNTADMVIETNATAITGGTDTVRSYLSGYTLDSNVENGRIMSAGTANLTGNTLSNHLYAGKGNNVINGGSGADTVSYYYGTDGSTGVTVSLASRTAQTTGGSGTDTLAGIENLTGSAYADMLTGSSGNNILTGGAGKDTLRGNGGNDTFDFNALAEMGTTSLTRDVIADFNAGDRIDLSSLDANTTTGTNNAFAYLGSVGAFSAAGQLRYDATAKLLYGNTDANLGTVEFAIQLTGVASLTVGDFVL